MTYTLSLNDEERSILLSILECAISEVHSEIVHCETFEYKDMLKDKKQVLIKLLKALQVQEESQG